MKIVYLVESYKDGLGYIDNILPIELTELGNKVCLITTDSEPYYTSGQNHFGSNLVRQDKDERAPVVRLKTLKLFGRVVWLVGLYNLLRGEKPEKVIIRAHASPMFVQLVVVQMLLKFDIYGCSGMAYSDLKPELRKKGPNLSKAIQFLTRYLPGRFLSFFAKASVGTGEDCCNVLSRYYGVPTRKLSNIPLGVDTNRFHPCLSEHDKVERQKLREKLGFSCKDIVCIWTGRMTGNKGLSTIVEAAEGLDDFKLLFVGNGPEKAVVENCDFAVCIDFKPWVELPGYYRAADIAVWPKITTSTLDASASGLPVIMSDAETMKERWEGIGCTYRDGDAFSLSDAMLSFKEQSLRDQIGLSASQKMRSHFSWNKVAKQYENLLLD